MNLREACSTLVTKIRDAYRARPLPAILVAAAALHLVFTLAVFMTGRCALMPSQFDAYGIGVFAHDGHYLQPEAEALADALKAGEFMAWARWPSMLHLKLYSLFIAVFGFHTGFNILTIEPLNLCYYLATLTLVFKLARETFDRRAALFAVALTGLWPSYLLHTTQLLKDPLLITAILVLMLILVRLLTTTHSWRGGVAAGVAASVAVFVIWLVRTSMWDVTRAVVVLGIVLLVVRQVRERRVLWRNVAGVVLLVAAVVIIPRYGVAFNSLRTMPGRFDPSAEIQQDMSLEERVAFRRDLFNGTDDDGETSGSTIDTGRQLRNKAEIARYLPRAAVIGFLAPFPNMWFAEGSKVHSSGRLLSGFEMLLTYAVELLALVGVWHGRHRFTTWLLLLTSAAGALGLGLVVRNIGTLYRLRYPFWMLLVILGGGGAVQLCARLSTRKRISGRGQVASV
ncbi:MAG: hypothetical protein ACJ741_18415 [Pyrinomonadaceae bacterium]